MATYIQFHGHRFTFIYMLMTSKFTALVQMPAWHLKFNKSEMDLLICLQPPNQLNFQPSSSQLMEKAKAPHSSTLAWKVPWTEEPGGLQSMGSWSRTRLSDFPFTFHFHALEKEMATHSSVLAWRIPGTGEPGGLPSMGSHRVRHDWSDLAASQLRATLIPSNQ